MEIIALQITSDGNVPIKTNASTLDLLAGSLPQGFYTTFSTLAHGTRVLDLQAHLNRLYIPAKESRLHPAVHEEILRERIAQVVKKNLPYESRVRLILTKATGEIFIGTQIFKRLPERVYTNGVHVITSNMARHDPQTKDTGFIAESIEQRKLLNTDVFEVLLVKNGGILEGLTSNFYVIKGRTISTAKHGILAGVTRKAILKIAKAQGMFLAYHVPRLGEKFDEAFLTSSSRGVVPIISIDNQPVGQGRVGKWTKQLAAAYQVYVLKKAESIIP